MKGATGTLTLDAALEHLGRPGTAIVAGGTDWYPALGGRPPPADVVDVTRIGGLDRIVRAADGSVRIGAAVTWSDVLRADLPPVFDALGAAARELGSVQIQNAATLVGNLCNASPAADGAAVLLALDARVELASRAGGRRELALGDFLLGPRRTARRADELVTAVTVPPHPPGSLSRFAKLGGRRYLVISIAMVAAVLAPDARGRIARARVVVGACAPVARRLPMLEARLLGHPIDDPALADLVEAGDLGVLTPIDDVRAGGAYRLDAVRTMLGRVLGGTLAGGSAEPSPPPLAAG